MQQLQDALQVILDSDEDLFKKHAFSFLSIIHNERIVQEDFIWNILLDIEGTLDELEDRIFQQS